MIAGAASVVGTISDAFSTNRWYRVDLLVKIQNKDTPSPGAGGNALAPETGLWTLKMVK